MPKPIHGLLDNLIEQFAAAVASRAEQMFARSAAGRAAVRPMGVRLCPNPGCKNPGAGPRNRWFCREHARSVPIREQKRILDMRCRVEGCKNISRGPRFGYICDKHRSELTAKQQREAREKWNAAHEKKSA